MMKRKFFQPQSIMVWMDTSNIYLQGLVIKQIILGLMSQTRYSSFSL